MSGLDSQYSDAFLDYFTTNALLNDMDALRVEEASTMTDSDMTTLAESIRLFGLGLDENNMGVVSSSPQFRSR